MDNAMKQLSEEELKAVTGEKESGQMWFLCCPLKSLICRQVLSAHR
ncbi:hypothetical protein [Methanoplanus endosymbiosus]|uniref:Uncharacterized protein n=1 Tax=Methanoplanus endosymbiosus TaxID=33865 RepID=A0A9E7TMC9_9EURY|nr:hypothetical protein [Methanoplanus endosymbiosus]UUX93151.1 hypothetical protein L6E24_03250 [Methanoplanus endosymbiosus]